MENNLRCDTNLRKLFSFRSLPQTLFIQEDINAVLSVWCKQSSISNKMNYAGWYGEKWFFQVLPLLQNPALVQIMRLSLTNTKPKGICLQCDCGVLVPRIIKGFLRKSFDLPYSEAKEISANSAIFWPTQLGELAQISIALRRNC